MSSAKSTVLVFLLLGAGLMAGLVGCQSESAASEGRAAAPDSTQDRFEAVMAYAQDNDLHERSIGAIMQAVGIRFMERPYLAGTLDEPPTEQLVIRFDGFDCVTYVETMLALARGIAVEDYSYATFADHMRDQRYRDGTMEGYCSRLHYFSEWVRDNARRGTVRNMTAALGGEALGDTLSFMSAHRSAYPRFATNDSLLACVRDMEQNLRGQSVRYVPQDDIDAVYDRLQAGDILGLVTNIDGLDIAHTGLVYAGKDGQIGLLHASTSEGVTVSPDLQAYVQNIDHQIGILVARPTEPQPQ